MEKQHPLTDLMGTAMEKIRTMVDANTIIGTPIQTGDVTLIPVSRLSFGIASGGSDFTTKLRHLVHHLGDRLDDPVHRGCRRRRHRQQLDALPPDDEEGHRLQLGAGPAAAAETVVRLRLLIFCGGQGDGVLGEAAGEEGTARSGRGGIRLRGRSAGDKQESGGAYWTHPNDEVMGIETPSGRGGGPSAVSEYPAHGPWDGHLRRLRHPDGGRERAGPL